MSKMHRIKVNEFALTRIIDALDKDSKVIGYPIVSLEDSDIVVYYKYEEHPSIGQAELSTFKKSRGVLLEGKNFPASPSHPRHNDYPNVKDNKKLPPMDDALDTILND